MQRGGRAETLAVRALGLRRVLGAGFEAWGLGLCSMEKGVCFGDLKSKGF